MSSRALRKAQRQLEEQQALDVAEVTDEEEEEGSEDDTKPTQAATKSLFALLNEDGDNEDQDAADGSKKSDDEDSPITTPKTVESKPSKSAEKKKKNKRKKSKKAAEAADSSKDEDIDAALRSLNGPAMKNKSDKSRPENKLDTICRLLSVNSQNLHVLNEMRRLFGREAMDAERRPAPNQNPRRRGQGNEHEQRQGFPTLSLRRNIFIQGKEAWPRATTGGLGMEIAKDSNDFSVLKKDWEKSGVVEYRFVHSTAYQDTQRQYELGVASMDPQRLLMHLHQNPYHIATLLQVSEIFKHEGSHSESGDLLERALFAFGRSIHSTFGQKLAQGKARLDFNRPENREFFFAIWKYVQNLSMRSTWRTVYEWAKLVLSLSPEWDPLCMRLVMDQYALRSNQAQHYIDLETADCFKFRSPERGVDFRIGEHIPWSLSLAYLQIGQLDKAKEVLYDTIESEPWVAVRWYKEFDLEPIPSALWSFHESPTPRYALFDELYITRAKDLWNTPEAKSLLTSVASTVKALPHLGELSGSLNRQPGFTMDEARHVSLTENDNFLRLLNSGISQVEAEYAPNLDAIGTNGADPWPPRGNLVSYDPIPPGLIRGPAGPGVDILNQISPQDLERLVREIQQLHTADGDGLRVDEDDEDYHNLVDNFGRGSETLPEYESDDGDEMPELEPWGGNDVD